MMQTDNTPDSGEFAGTDSAAARGWSCLAVVALSLALWAGCAALIVWLR